jgi:hypothetical protein
MADTIYLIRDGHLYKHRENDGASYLKRGPQEQVTCLGTVEEAEVKYPRELELAMRGLKHAVREQSKTI